MFWKNKKQEQKKIEELNKKIDRLESSLHKLFEQDNKGQGVTYEVTIENFNVSDPVLESLTFRFDKLDVKEVSGALNLGNNFGVKVEPQSKSQSSSTKAKQPSSSKSKQSLDSKKQKQESTQRWFDDSIKRHDKGMTFHFNE